MTRIIWVFGSLAGIILAGSFFTGFLLGADTEHHSILVGYLIMLLALSFVFVGVKRYRDVVQGGVISFGTALKVGLGIALVAALFYVLGWEAYMYATNYSFMDAYTQSMIAAEKAKGTGAAEIAKITRELNEFAQEYANPLFRMAMTFTEIAPVGLLVALVSAGLLRNAKFLPARGG